MDGPKKDYSTPTIPASEAALVLHSEIKINAPAALVFRSLRKIETWRDWNKFIPKVNITYQPPDEDTATAAEIQELVRNTSIAGSFYSDLTDGGVGNRSRSPDEQPPPRFRLNSISSQMSQESESDQQPRRSIGEAMNGNGPRASIASGASTKSAAQKFQEAQESRRASVASGQEPAPIVNRVENSETHRGSVALPPGSSLSPKSKSAKPRQSLSSPSAAKAHAALMSIYGEPSVRLQIKTKMTFYMRMKPHSPSEFTESNMVVTDISRPDDPINEAGTTALTRTKTHHLDRAGHYRVVWANDSGGSSIFNVTNVFKTSNVPKYLLQAERVHEIEPVDEGTCVYRTWECQKGHAAKNNKKKNGDYLQKMFEVWSSGLKDFCEGLHAPKIARRDFSIDAGDVPFVIQTVT